MVREHVSFQPEDISIYPFNHSTENLQELLNSFKLVYFLNVLVSEWKLHAESFFFSIHIDIQPVSVCRWRKMYLWCSILEKEQRPKF